MTATKTSIVRTLTTIAVGFILNLPVTPWVLNALNVTTDQASAYIGGGVTAIVGAIYYAIARYLEENKNTAWGYLLGLANRPVYSNTPAVNAPDDDFNRS